MKKITNIHARLSSEVNLQILYLLNEFGEMSVRDVVKVIGKSGPQMNYILNQIEEAGLITRTLLSEKGDQPGRNVKVSINKSLAPFYLHTIYTISDHAEIKELKRKYQEWVKSGRK